MSLIAASLPLPLVPDTAQTISATPYTPRIDVADSFVTPRMKGTDLRYLYRGHGDTHYMDAIVSKDGTLGFDIRAGGDAATLGGGKDMFYGLMKRLDTDGVQVNQIRGMWLDGDGSVNYEQFRQFTTGSPTLTPAEAASKTWTGQRATEFGYTNVVKLQNFDQEVKVWFAKPTP